MLTAHKCTYCNKKNNTLCGIINVHFISTALTSQLQPLTSDLCDQTVHHAFFSRPSPSLHSVATQGGSTCGGAELPATSAMLLPLDGCSDGVACGSSSTLAHSQPGKNIRMCAGTGRQVGGLLYTWVAKQ